MAAALDRVSYEIFNLNYFWNMKLKLRRVSLTWLRGKWPLLFICITTSLAGDESRRLDKLEPQTTCHKDSEVEFEDKVFSTLYEIVKTF